MIPEPFVPVATIFLGMSATTIGLLSCVVLLCALGFAKTKDVLITLLIAVYSATACTTVFPIYGASWFGFVLHEQTARLLVFSIMFLVVVLSLRGYVCSVYQQSVLWRTVEIVVLSCMIVGIVFSMMVHVGGLTSILHIDQTVLTLFTSPYALLFWISAPMLSIPLFVRHS